MWKKDEIVLVVNQDSRKAISRAKLLQKLAKKYHLRTVLCEGRDLDYTLRLELQNKALKRLIVAGGDGSVSTATSLVVRSKQKVELAIIPVGTSNYYAKTLRIKTVEQSFDAAVNGTVEQRYVCEANGRVFLMVANFGAVSQMFYEVSDNGKKHFGKLAYAWGMIKMFASFTPMKVTISVPGSKTVTYATTEAQIINQSIRERVRLHPEVDSKDPYFEIVTFGLKETKLSPIIAILIFIISLGKNQRYLRRIRATEARITVNRPELVSLDGDTLENTPIHVRVVKDPVMFVGR